MRQDPLFCSDTAVKGRYGWFTLRAGRGFSLDSSKKHFATILTRRQPCTSKRGHLKALFFVLGVLDRTTLPLRTSLAHPESVPNPNHFSIRIQTYNAMWEPRQHLSLTWFAFSETLIRRIMERPITKARECRSATSTSARISPPQFGASVGETQDTVNQKHRRKRHSNLDAPP